MLTILSTAVRVVISRANETPSEQYCAILTSVVIVASHWHCLRGIQMLTICIGYEKCILKKHIKIV